MVAEDSLPNRPAPPNNLRAYRLGRGWSQAQLAKEARCSTEPISAAERRLRLLSPLIKSRLSNALNAPVHDIFPND